MVAEPGGVHAIKWAPPTIPVRFTIHVIVDNLSAHKTQKVRTFLAAHPAVQLHDTPTYSSWLNHVELWFSKIERDVIARGIFTSVPVWQASAGVP